MRLGYGLITCERTHGDPRTWVDRYREALQFSRLCEENGLELNEPTDEQYAAVSPRLSAGVRASLTVEASLAARSSPGGTAPERVREQISALTARVRELEKAES